MACPDLYEGSMTTPDGLTWWVTYRREDFMREYPDARPYSETGILPPDDVRTWAVMEHGWPSEDGWLFVQ